MERARGEQYYCGALNVTPKKIGHGLVLFFPPPVTKALRLSYKNMKIIAQRLPNEWNGRVVSNITAAL